MRIRIRVPLNGYFIGPNDQVVQPTTSFEHDGRQVALRFEGLGPVAAQDMPEDVRYVFFTQAVALEIGEPAPGAGGPDVLEGLTEQGRRSDLIQFLLPAVNRVLSAIRNFGVVVHVSPVTCEPGEAEGVLREWKTEITRDGARWDP